MEKINRSCQFSFNIHHALNGTKNVIYLVAIFTICCFHFRRAGTHKLTHIDTLLNKLK